MTTWLEWATLVMQFVIMLVVTASALAAYRAYLANRKTLNAIAAYRREMEWMGARLDALERGAKTNGRVENGRSK